MAFFCTLSRNRLNLLYKSIIKSKLTVTSTRNIMFTKSRLDKVVQELQRNPYYDKYAEKIAKMQKTSPEEFLQRVEEKERKIKEEKVLPRNKLNLSTCWSTEIQPHHYHNIANVNKFSARNFSQDVKQSMLITTPIYYVNSVPHIGHLYTGVLADAINRFHKMLGHATLLTTGTDEHGSKVEKAAKLVHLHPEDYCKAISEKYKEMCDVFDIGYTDFVRTTEERHVKSVHHFWNTLVENGHIYKGKYSGWYCTPEEAFLSNDDLIEKEGVNGEKIKVSAASGHPVEWTEEENYKFRLSSFKSDLKYWLKDVKVVQPQNFHNILSQWIEDEVCLKDLSISRPVSRVSWGIPVPNDSAQTVYVWLDALINYLTTLGYPNPRFKEFWPPSIQVIGKDILKFHGIYWPAFLMAAGLEPPKVLFCHSHWKVDDEKMSKSKNNVVCPFSISKNVTPDGLRYFLLRDSVPQNDSNYSSLRIQNILNSELSNTFGNMINRCVAETVNPKKLIPSVAYHGYILKSEAADNLRKQLESLGDNAKKHYESFYVHHAIDEIMSAIRSANCLIDFHKPWALRKDPYDEAAALEVKAVISLALETARISAIALSPVIPSLCGDLLDFLNIPLLERTWADTRPKYLPPIASTFNEHLKQETLLLFPRLKL